MLVRCVKVRIFVFAVIFGALGLPVAAGFSVAFFRRFRSLLVASAGFAAMNALTRERRETPPSPSQPVSES